MFSALKREWRTLQTAPPGERFRRAFHNRNDEGRPLWQRGLSILLSLVIVVVGVVALPAPGPGTLVLVLGLGLLGREIGPVARTLDWLELLLRRIWRWVRLTWKHAGTLGRVGMVALAALVGLAVLGTAGLMAYRMFFD